MTQAPDWLKQALAGRKVWRAGIIREMLPEEMPPLVVDGYTLAAPEVNAVLALLKSQDENFITQLRDHADPHQCRAFALRVYQGWVADGAKTDHRWALFAYARLAHKATVPTLIQFVQHNQKRKESLYVKIGLQALLFTDCQEAYFYLYTVWLTSKTTDFRRNAKKHLEAAAAAKGMTLVQLGDQIVPDESPDGKVLDYGNRHFTIELTGELTLTLRDAQGKVRSSLPKPGKRDNTQLVAAAQQVWDSDQRFVEAVSAVQSALLERAMNEQRCWSVPEFEQIFLRHSLMRNFAQRLIWNVGDSAHLTSNTFHVAADLSLSNAHYRPVEIPPDTFVTLVHPVYLSEDERLLWGEVLHDYEIIQPLQQIMRDIYRPTPEEIESGQITRFVGVKLHEKKLFSGKGSLRRFGWTQHYNMEARATIFERHFPQSDVAAVVVIKAVYTYGYSYHIESQYFQTGNNRVPLAQVNPIIISESLRNLIRITSHDRTDSTPNG